MHFPLSILVQHSVSTGVGGWDVVLDVGFGVVYTGGTDVFKVAFGVAVVVLIIRVGFVVFIEGLLTLLLKVLITKVTGSPWVDFGDVEMVVPCPPVFITMFGIKGFVLL